jgi:5-methylcytosine-specific restriction endonuclease McrA
MGRGGIARETLQPLVDAGMTIAQIAAEVERTPTTVRLWLQRHGLRTAASRHANAVREARADGLARTVMQCRFHGDVDFALEGRGYYRCTRCRQERVARRRRRMKEILVSEAGGACCVCGYRRYLGALQFHHLSPDDKRLGISGNGVTLSLAALRAEASKCVLVCSNCHAELEGGVIELPLKIDCRLPSKVDERPAKDSSITP